MENTWSLLSLSEAQPRIEMACFTPVPRPAWCLGRRSGSLALFRDGERDGRGGENKIDGRTDPPLLALYSLRPALRLLFLPSG